MDVVTRVSAHDISQRAYGLFQERGREHGHDLEDWLLAEAELRKGNGPAVVTSVDTERRLQDARRHGCATLTVIV